jgi:transposase-like protein
LKQRQGSAFWLANVEALNLQLISTSEYAKRHGIAVKRLYYWQRKLRTTASKVPVRAGQAKAFIAVRVAEPVVEQRPFSCTLRIGNSIA